MNLSISSFEMKVLFFCQAEDVIRDDLVTGVQTCALPICMLFVDHKKSIRAFLAGGHPAPYASACSCRGAKGGTVVISPQPWQRFYDPGVPPSVALERSEERRVGKERDDRSIA